MTRSPSAPPSDADPASARSVLVIGSANLDFVVRAPRIPAPGETVMGLSFATHPGGKGANQAVACARAGGAPTRFLVALGDDPYAAPLEASLREAGVRAEVVRDATRPTGTAFICVDDAAENAITVAPGANAMLEPRHLPPLEGVAVLLLQLETPLASVAAYAVAARAAGVTVVLNAAPAQALTTALLEAVDVLVVNEGELAVISGVAGNRDQALALLPMPTVIVTLGAAGLVARHRGHALRIPAHAVEPVDTTAAGDTFCGTLAAALARAATVEPTVETLTVALQEASAAAALACTRAGAQTSIPAREEVLALLAAASPASSPTSHRS